MFCIICFMFFPYCNNSKKNIITETIVEREENAKNENKSKSDINFENKEFELFYAKFISDSLFQMEHIKFPVKGMISECDTTIYLTRSNWKFFSEDIRISVNNSLDTNKIEQDSLKFHYLNIRKEVGTLFEIEFKKIDGNWYLVYYFLNAC